MTTSEFITLVGKAESLQELNDLRNSRLAPAFKALVKNKIYRLLKLQDFEKFELNTQTMRNTAVKIPVGVKCFSTDSGSFNYCTVISSRKLKKYVGKQVIIYVHEKTAKGNGITIFIKEVASC